MSDFTVSNFENLKSLISELEFDSEKSRDALLFSLLEMAMRFVSSERYCEFSEVPLKSKISKDLIRICVELSELKGAVLICGEKGVGKEFFARKIHGAGNRKNSGFLKIRCSDFTGNEIFYSERIKNSTGGTIFFDEVGNLSEEGQKILLDLLNSGKISTELSVEKECDVRIIASSSVDLEKLVSDGKFSYDLLQKLSVFMLRVPPLRERKDDILGFAEYFLEKFSYENGKIFSGFSDDATGFMLDCHWDGNIRELANNIEHSCIKCHCGKISADDFSSPEKNLSQSEEILNILNRIESEDGNGDDFKMALKKFKAAYIYKVLGKCKWNQTEAAKILGIQRPYVNRLMTELHLR